MMTVQTHRKIRDLLADWERLERLYTAIQTEKNLTVQVNGTYHDEFREAAIVEAKKILEKDAARIKADLSQLGLDVSTLPQLVEVPRATKN